MKACETNLKVQTHCTQIWGKEHNYQVLSVHPSYHAATSNSSSSLMLLYSVRVTSVTSGDHTKVRWGRGQGNKPGRRDGDGFSLVPWDKTLHQYLENEIQRSSLPPSTHLIGRV